MNTVSVSFPNWCEWGVLGHSATKCAWCYPGDVPHGVPGRVPVGAAAGAGGGRLAVAGAGRGDGGGARHGHGGLPRLPLRLPAALPRLAARPLARAPAPSGTVPARYGNNTHFDVIIEGIHHRSHHSQ